MSKRISDLMQDEKHDFFQDHIVGNAPAIMAVFANLVVVFADYRAYDVVYQLTGVWWKALASSLACAIPFVLWEIAWQYNHTSENWRLASLLMAGVAFVTSLFLGVADYLQFSGQWTEILLGGVVILTGLHTVVGFLYYYNDPDVARRRRKAQALARMQDQELNADIAKDLLERGDSLLGVLKGLEGKYSPDDIEMMLAMLQGRKAPERSNMRKPQQQQNRNGSQQPAYSQHTERQELERPANFQNPPRPNP